MDLRMMLGAVVLTLGCSATTKDTDPMTTETTTSGATTGEPATTGGPPATAGPTTTGDQTTDDPAPTGGSTVATDATSTGTDSEGSSPECVLYCDEFMPNCGEIADVEVYDDLTDCLDTCATWAHGPAGAFMGDTVECRIAHLTFDPAKPPGYYETHCFHAQEHPTANCV